MKPEFGQLLQKAVAKKIKGGKSPKKPTDLLTSALMKQMMPDSDKDGM